VAAGASLSVKFGLGGNFGLGVFAAGYPKSVEIDCDTLAATGAATAASGKLAYDASSGRYVYTWKTAKSYGDSCRRLELRFQNFPGLTLNVTFRK
jgi:hypothetical protein